VFLSRLQNEVLVARKALGYLDSIISSAKRELVKYCGSEDLAALLWLYLRGKAPAPVIQLEEMACVVDAASIPVIDDFRRQLLDAPVAAAAAAADAEARRAKRPHCEDLTDESSVVRGLI
jgi:hypothetical protein